MKSRILDNRYYPYYKILLYCVYEDNRCKYTYYNILHVYVHTIVCI